MTHVKGHKGRHSTHRKGSRKHLKGRRSSQRGGDGNGQYGFSGPAFTAAAGVPIESRDASYTHCGWDVRPAAPDVSAYKTVQFGGRKSSRKSQRGGGCGCMASPPLQAGGGGGSGGHAVMLSNELGKVYDSLQVHPCPPTPRETQIGGSEAAALVSYKSGFGYDQGSVVSTPSAHYLTPQGYDRTVMTGGRKSHRKGSRSAHRKGSRSAHRKGSRSAHRKGRKSRKSRR